MQHTVIEGGGVVPAGEPPGASLADFGGPERTTLEHYAASAVDAVILPPSAMLSDLIEWFDDGGVFHALIVGDDRLVHSLSRDALARLLARPYVRELYRRRRVAELAADHPLDLCELPFDCEIPRAIEAALRRSPASRWEPIVAHATGRGRMVFELQALLLAQCELLTRMTGLLQCQRAELDVAGRERDAMNLQLVAASRIAGRAEVATGVLHNVGNVLNSLNVSLSQVERSLQRSKLPNLSKATDLLAEQSGRLAEFLTVDERGKVLPGYLIKLAGVLREEQDAIAREAASMSGSVEHIKQIVQMQQEHAKGGVCVEAVRPATLVEDALRVNTVSLDRHNVRVVQDLPDLGTVRVDKHRVLQILINLISNAKNATKHRRAEDRQIAVRIDLTGHSAGQGVGRQTLRISVSDNGVGIAPDALARIFSHGYTTRKDGHGFGLHASANAAREMDGSLTVHSDGPGQGATFSLSVPIDAQPYADRPEPTEIRMQDLASMPLMSTGARQEAA